MKRAILFGIGDHYRRYARELHQTYDIVALCDNDPAKQGGEVDGRTVLRPDSVNWDEYEVVVIVPNAAEAAEAVFQQIRGYGVAVDRMEWFTRKGEALRSVWVDDRSGIKINITSLSDYSVAKEVFISREYEVGLSSGDWVCVDAGMNVGCASLYFASLPHIQKVYGYELLESTWRKALANIVLNPGPENKIEPRNAGLSNRNGEIRVSESAFSGNASLYSTANGAEKTAFITDAAETLAPIYAEHVGKAKILLKVDTEGSEYDIFESLNGAGLLAVTDAIIGEWHNIFAQAEGWYYSAEQEALLNRLRRVFSENGFRYKLTDTHKGIGYFYAFR